MKITLESTPQIVTMNGVPCRVWTGQSERGAKIECFIVRVAVRTDQPEIVIQDFERELQETRAPSAEMQAWPLRMIL